MAQDRTTHWQSVYGRKEPTEVSWFQPHLNVSLDLLKKAGLSERSRVLDVGAGASTLVDDLLQLGVASITALDLSEASLSASRIRLGERSSQVHWIVGDITKLHLPAASIDLWHDRAALHFLVNRADTDAYVKLASRAIVSGGHAVIGGFAADGPERCSGLPVARRDPAQISELFGPSFVLVEGRREIHSTPQGRSQRFAYSLLRKT